MAKLTEEDSKFLSSLNQDGSPTGYRKIPMASREQDRARTRSKKNGWAVFDRATCRWSITPAGRAALTEG